MGFIGTALEFRMKLDTNKECLICQLDRFDQMSIRRQTGETQSGFGESFTVGIIDFIAVAVTFADMFLTIKREDLCSRLQITGVFPQPKGTAFVDRIILSRHKVDNRIEGELIELPGVGAGKGCHVTSIFDHGNLQTEADTKIRNVMFSCIAAGCDHTLDPAASKATGHDDSIDTGQNGGGVFICDGFGIDPADRNMGVECIACVAQSFCYRKVSIMQLNIFSYQSDRYFLSL